MSPLEIFVILIFSIALCGGEKVRYDDYAVYRITPTNSEALTYLQDLKISAKEFTFFNEPVNINQAVDILVPPHLQDKIEKFLRTNELDAVVPISNLQKLIENEKAKVKDSAFDLGDYHTIEEINNWLNELATNYSDIATLVKGGTTYEGRDILGIHLKFGLGNENRSVMFEGTIHANEWITTAVVTYILNELLTSVDPAVRAIAESHEWYIFPVLNVDGFVYTHTTDRMWRKTRVPYGNESCTGADPNRNWDHHFYDVNDTQMDTPCDHMYRGPEPFSEPTIRSFSEFIASIGSNLQAYISFHSYAQKLLIPYGYTDAHLDNYDDLYNIGIKAMDTLAQRYGTEYEVGTIFEIMYIACGSSMDWVKGNFRTPITYSYELRDQGEYGFILPADQIIPSGEETLDSLITIFNEFDKIGTASETGDVEL